MKLTRPCLQRVVAGLSLALAWPALCAVDPAPATLPTTAPTTIHRSLEPTLLSVHQHDASPKAIFEDIARQSGLDFHTSAFDALPRALPKASVDIEAQPFWAVMSEACVKTNVFPHVLAPRSIALTLNGRGWMDGQCEVSGGFLVVANQVWHSVRVARPQEGQELKVALSAVPELTLRCVRGSKFAKVDEATDDKGQSLLPKQPPSDTPVPGGPMGWTSEAVLQMPAEAGTRIAKLKGSLRFLAQTQAQVWEVADIAAAANVTATIGGRALVIQELSKKDELYELRVAALHKGSKTDEEAAQQVLHLADLTLLDEKGQPLSRQTALRNNAPGQVEMTFTFARTAEPGKASPEIQRNWCGKCPVPLKRSP